MKTLRIILPVALVALCCSPKAFAGFPPGTPEVNPADGVAVLALVAGAATIFRSRIKR